MDAIICTEDYTWEVINISDNGEWIGCEKAFLLTPMPNGQHEIFGEQFNNCCWLVSKLQWMIELPSEMPD
jgi:hypothetical protein